MKLMIGLVFTRIGERCAEWGDGNLWEQPAQILQETERRIKEPSDQPKIEIS